MSSVYLVLYVEKILVTSFSLPLSVLSLWFLAVDLEDYHPSVLLHCWLGHLTCKIVSEMTCNVSSGTLNPYHTWMRSYVSVHVGTTAHFSTCSVFLLHISPVLVCI